MLVIEGNNFTVEEDKQEIKPLSEVDEIKAFVDEAIHIDGALLITGWIYDPNKLIVGFSTAKRVSDWSSETPIDLLEIESDRLQSLKFERYDVSEAMQYEGDDHQHGFFLVIPEFSLGNSLLIKTEYDLYIDLPIEPTTSSCEVKEKLSNFVDEKIYEKLCIALGERHKISDFVGKKLLNNGFELKRYAHCDKALLLNNEWLILNGWIGTPHSEIASLEVSINENYTRCSNRLKHYVRPDLKSIFPKAASDAMGYITVISIPELLVREIDVCVYWENNKYEKMTLEVESITWKALNEYLTSWPSLYPLVIDELERESKTNNINYFFRNELRNFVEKTYPSYVKNYPTAVHNSDCIIAAIDKAYVINKKGLLIYGWKISPEGEPDDITVHDELGNYVSIKEKLLPQLREDVASSYLEQVPNVPNRCGFIAFIPLPTEVGDERALCFHYRDRGDVWLRLNLETNATPSVDLIKNMLGMIPHPDQINHYIYEMFDNGLGEAIEEVNQQRLLEAPSDKLQTTVKQFGEIPEYPTTSIIIPLYGRYDFMQYQLASFADDPQIKTSDIIYVVDDPNIIDQVLSLAARYQWIFNIPFRVVYYGKNIGFAGANNVGAKFAIAERLLLLNSDVIPKNINWLSLLETALDTLPNAGAVGPLLQFGDNSVQHAGMHPRYEPQLPGFLINTHPGMGQSWGNEEDSNIPYPQPMLTAACLMLRTKHFNECNGFDEGYVIGDFEDSDLCLKLRTRGMCLYLIPEARLWHLERQSQVLGNVANVRQLVTLFNGWRYLKKIKTGTLIHPLDEKFISGSKI